MSLVALVSVGLLIGAGVLVTLFLWLAIRRVR